MKKHEHIVKNVEAGSIAEELGIEPGDRLLAIDGQEIEDIFDYQFYEESEELLLLIEKADGEQWELEIEKDADESLGSSWEWNLVRALWMNTVPAATGASSVLSIRCRRG